MKDRHCANRSVFPGMETFAPQASRVGAERRSWFFGIHKSLAPLYPGLRGFQAIGITFSVLTLLLCVGGCGIEPSDPPTIQSWQQSLEKYVWDRGNGDPNVLADLSWDDVHRGFAVIGDSLPERSVDQIGLLVAHRTFHGKPYFVFLLASVRYQELKGLRAVALRVEGDAFHWAIGDDDPKALALYQSWSDADRARDLSPGPKPPPFPADDTSFAVTIEEDRFVIRHHESGAQWRVQPASPVVITDSHPAKS